MPRAKRRTEEFYCGECRGYFMVTLNVAINHEVEVVCPSCGHEHRRCVANGHILERGRHSTPVKEKLRPSIASYSKHPFTEKMRSSASHRDGEVLSPVMLDRWLEVAAREKGVGHDDNNEFTN